MRVNGMCTRRLRVCARHHSIVRNVARFDHTAMIISFLSSMMTFPESKNDVTCRPSRSTTTRSTPSSSTQWWRRFGTCCRTCFRGWGMGLCGFEGFPTFTDVPRVPFLHLALFVQTVSSAVMLVNSPLSPIAIHVASFDSLRAPLVSSPSSPSSLSWFSRRGLHPLSSQPSMRT